MTRKCSSCSHNGHNARTCSARGVKLFGVRLTDGAIRKSASMGNLSHYAGLNIGGCGSSPADGLENGGRAADGYASEGFVKGSSSSCAARKKGVPWTEEEHRMFLLGLKKLGKGEWRGIARNFVVSRSPAQVASHAQKYFLRQMNTSGRKRRSSLFDMIPDEVSETQQSPTDGSEEAEAQGQNQQPPLPPLPDDESESMDSSSNDLETAIPAPIPAPCTYPVVYPAYFMPVFLPVPYWPSYQLDNAGREVHGIVRPTAVHPNTPIDVNELVGMSQLSLGESIGRPPSALSLGGSDRQSAFHANPPRKDTSTNSGASPIHAV
ncbi:putative transcription factor MYB-HB-like family [Dioscorea sansibarensis]